MTNEQIKEIATSHSRPEQRAEVFDVLDQERVYQELRWKGPKHSIEEWAYFMEDYLAELKRLRSRNDGELVKGQSMHIFRKITALGVACMEEHGAVSREGKVSTQPPAIDLDSIQPGMDKETLVRVSEEIARRVRREMI